MLKHNSIYVAGHNGLVGSAIVRLLLRSGYKNIITKSSQDLDLTKQSNVDIFFSKTKPDFVFIAAAKVGGIFANNLFKADFIYDNIMIQSNLISACKKHEVKKMVFLGSSCVYPRISKQPIKENYLLSGSLEPTNEPYAIAKIAGIKMCESFFRQYASEFISLMPTNLYGPNDNYNLKTSHVIPALIRKIYEAKLSDKNKVVIWGSGEAQREFLHVDDLARACLFSMKKISAEKIYNQLNVSHINIGSGKEIKIKELSYLIKDLIEYKGDLVFDISKPDGTPKKLLDTSIANKIGWAPKIDLHDGLEHTIKSYIEKRTIQ